MYEYKRNKSKWKEQMKKLSMREGKQENETGDKETKKQRNSRKKQLKICHNFPEEIGQLSASSSDVCFDLACCGVHTSNRS